MKKDDDEGFTLIELLVVVLILGILMAIAIPTFLSLTGGAKTSAAESDLTTGSQDEATYFTQNGTYDTSVTTNVADMVAIDTGINWVATTPAAAGTKSVAVVWISGTNIELVTKSSNGNYYAVQLLSGQLRYAYAAVANPVAGDFTFTSWGGIGSAAASAT